ncbi:rho GTPase-activating protein 6 [Stigmatopora nigra]
MCFKSNMSAHGLLSSVFSCSLSPKTISKRGLRQTRSLDPALMRHYAVESTSYQGGFTWNSVSGRSVGLKPIPLQSLSELERVRLRDVAFRRLLRDRHLGCHVTIPKYGYKYKKSLRCKLDSLSKEKSKDKEAMTPQVFGIPLAQVICNDRKHKRRQDRPPEQHCDPTELVLSFLHFTSTFKRVNKELSSSNSSLSSNSESPNKSPFAAALDVPPRPHRRGGVSVDCITDLDDNQSQLLEALQLSLPVEVTGKNRKKRHDKKLSLNPMYPQVPRVVELCCQHLENHALQTVGIFRVGSSKKRVRQMREELDQGWDLQLDQNHSVHDVAALLKEFLRDMPDPLLTRELYAAFVNSTLLERGEQQKAIQLLMFLLPPCHCDTLHRLLCSLSAVAARAEDMLDDDGHKKPGNKMTSLNLATILGPNLLHKQKNPEKEFAVQSLARAEESGAIIDVLQNMINACDSLFLVPADLQNEVFLSLLETDPDVVDYLLRRQDTRYSHSNLVAPTESSSMERCSSNESVSSGEASPYDNSSPVISERFLTPEDDGASVQSAARSSPTTTAGDCSEDHFWDSWHPLFSNDVIDLNLNGSLGSISERKSFGSSEALAGHQGNNKLPVSPSPISLDASEREPRLPAGHGNQWGVARSDAIERERGERLFRPLGEMRLFHSAPSIGQSAGPRTAPHRKGNGHIWQILSKSNGDALPETLV